MLTETVLPGQLADKLLAILCSGTAAPALIQHLPCVGTECMRLAEFRVDHQPCTWRRIPGRMLPCWLIAHIAWVGKAAHMLLWPNCKACCIVRDCICAGWMRWLFDEPHDCTVDAEALVATVPCSAVGTTAHECQLSTKS